MVEEASLQSFDFNLQRGFDGLEVTYLNATDLWRLALGRTMGEKGWLTDQALDIWYDCCDGKEMLKIGSWGKNDPKMSCFRCFRWVALALVVILRCV